MRSSSRMSLLPKRGSTDDATPVPGRQGKQSPYTNIVLAFEGSEDTGTAAVMADNNPSSSSVSMNECVYINVEVFSKTFDPVERNLIERLMAGNFHEEFKALPSGLHSSHKSGTAETNSNKNRFTSILPYDHNRVVLQKPYDSDSNSYINASYIRGYNTSQIYIAAQGPKENTVNDFWKMVWQENVTHIVMLTNVLEGSRTKCEVYWPFLGAQQCYGTISVSGVEVESRANFIIRRLNVRSLSSALSRRVTQYQYTTWMDHSIPTSPALVDFWRTVRNSHRKKYSPSPLLVHCSAGVGRTGTYIALDIALDQAEQEPRVDIPAIVRRARDDRCNLIQALSQYIFLHEAVLEAYMSRHTRFDVGAFDSLFPQKIDPFSKNDRIDAEFEKLERMKLLCHKGDYTEATKTENINKNRYHNILPDDKHVVRLTRHVEGRNNYINAVFMPTIREELGYILTQLPLPETVVDLWRLIEGDNVTTVVSLGPITDEQHSLLYWPRTDTHVMRIGPYVISLKRKLKINDAVTKYIISLNNEENKQSRQIFLLHYERWAEYIPDSASYLLQLVEIILSDDCESPVVLQCCDGAGKSGLFCALCDVIRRMVADDNIDVFMAVRNVHIIREQCVSTTIQYRYLYHVIQEYWKKMTSYANM